VTFSIATANGTAVAGTDYVARTLTGQAIAAGQSSKTFAVTVNGDTTVENNETLKAVVSAVAGAVVVDDTGTGKLLNDDGPNLRVADVAVTEGNAGTKAMTFTVSTPVAAAAPITYTLASSNGNATAGSDYTAVTYAAQTLAAGMLARTHTVTIAGDATVEQNERVLMSLTGVSGASIYDSQGIGTILNDDGPTLSIADIDVVEGNGGTPAKATFTVKLSQAATVPVTYSIATGNDTATAGSDYTARSLVGEAIPAGALSRTFVVDVTGDAIAEPNELFTANLTAAGGATILDGQATARIRNDDGLYAWIADATTSEGNSGTRVLTFTVQLSQAAGAAQTFDIATSDGTATVGGNDYVAMAASALAIPAGPSCIASGVTITGDAAFEPTETFKVNLSNFAGTATVLDPQAIGTITNDD
jgi:hypothetical protein